MNYKVIPMAIFFITGTSGSGKSTLMENLKLKLSPLHFAVYDFDEIGVPANADQEWRQNTTDYWLQKSYEHSLEGKSTVICGVVVPSEVLNSDYKLAMNIYFGFIKVDDNIITQRLLERGWNQQLIDDNLNWACYLEKEVMQHHNSFLLDTNVLSSKEIVEVAVKCIENQTTEYFS